MESEPSLQILPYAFRGSLGCLKIFWLNLQTRYNLEVEKDRLAGRLEKEVKVYVGQDVDNQGG